MIVVIVVIGLVVVVVAVVGVRSSWNKRINEMPALQMPLLTPMAMTPNPEPVFPSPTDETDPSSTVVPGVYVSMPWLYGCLGGCTSVLMHGCIAVYGGLCGVLLCQLMCMYV